MASAEHLLHEAQFAFQSISFGESRGNTRNASRARSLCRKIISKYAGSMEAGEAHAILRRLGDEAYQSKMAVQHRHISQAEHHGAKALERAKARTPVPEPLITFGDDDTAETLDWGGLVSLILLAPKITIALIAFAGLFLFGIFGPFLFIPLVAFVLLTGPFRRSMKSEQRRNLNEFVKRTNAYIAERRRG